MRSHLVGSVATTTTAAAAAASRRTSWWAVQLGQVVVL